MKVLVDNDWVKRAAEIEDGCEVGAGVMHPEAPNSHAEMLSVIATQAAQIEALIKHRDDAVERIAAANLQIEALTKALAQARNQVVAFAIPQVGAESAEKSVAYIDAALAAVGAKHD